MSSSSIQHENILPFSKDSQEKVKKLKKEKNYFNPEIMGYFRETLQSRLGELEYKIWLADLQIKPLKEKIILYTSSYFKREKIVERYWKLLKELVGFHFPTLSLDLQILVTPSSDTALPSDFQESDSLRENSENKDTLEKETKLEVKVDDESNSFAFRRVLSENTLENFLEIVENKLAFRFISNALDKPGVINPIYIYGAVGVGKTHLLHAYANAYRKRVSFAKIDYFTPDDFVSDFTRALISKTDRNFRIYYRSLDVLLIDDIQFFMGKEKSSIEFFHVFNAIHASGKQMIFTSDRDPRELEQLDDRLKSRIASSAIIEIKSPNVASRKALIDFYIAKECLELHDDVKEFLSENLPGDVRQLIGSIRYLAALNSLKDGEEDIPITIDYCQQHLKQLLPTRRKKKNYHPEKIIFAVCEHTGLSVKDLKSKKKSKQISRFRQSAMYLLRQYTNLSLPEIGFALGGRTISTVTYGIEKMAAELSGPNPAPLQDEIERILNRAAAASVF